VSSSHVGPKAVLTAIASYLPEALITNEAIVEQYQDWSEEKIVDTTGIHTRHTCADDEFTSDLAVKAAEALFAGDPGRRDDIDMLIVVTVSPDYITPHTSGLVQQALGLPTHVGALDVSLGCSGFTYALQLAAALIESGRSRKLLLITADRFTPYSEEGGQNVRTIFGDGATASLIEAQLPDGPVLSGGVIGATSFGTDGSGAEYLRIPTGAMRGFVGDTQQPFSKPTVEMDGPQVFAFTIRVISKHIHEFLKSQDLGVEDVDLFVFHQANLFMIDHLRRRMKIPEEKFALHIAEVGNTVASTIPLALEKAIAEDRVHSGDRVALVAFGVGYSWGSVLLDYQGSASAP